jgi:hypothetical protein
MFDFLKEMNQTEKKYKSTNQIPLLFSSEDLFETKSSYMPTSGETKMQKAKEEAYTPFFSIEEDLLMEDEISNSDCMTSEAGHESIESDYGNPTTGKHKIFYANVSGLP